MKNILLPTDFSENANAALQYAMRLAMDWRANINLVHAAPSPKVPANTPIDVYQEIVENELKEKKLKLKLLADNVQHLEEVKAKSVSIRQMLVRAPFCEGIIGTARQLQSELIVIGTKGASGIRQIFMGSNTLDLIRKSPLPVLVIPGTSSMPPLRHVVVAVNPKEYIPQEELTLVRELAAIYHAKVSVYCVLKKGDDFEQLKEKVDREVASSLSGLDYDWHYQLQKEVNEGISAFVTEQQADMLVMFPQKKSFWEQLLGKSHTQNIASKPKIPLLVLPKARELK